MPTAQEQARSVPSGMNCPSESDIRMDSSAAGELHRLNEVSDQSDALLARYSQPMTNACREHAIGIAKRLLVRAIERYRETHNADYMDAAFVHVEQIRTLEVGRKGLAA